MFETLFSRKEPQHDRRITDPAHQNDIMHPPLGLSLRESLGIEERLVDTKVGAPITLRSGTTEDVRYRNSDITFGEVVDLLTEQGFLKFTHAKDGALTFVKLKDIQDLAQLKQMLKERYPNSNLSCKGETSITPGDLHKELDALRDAARTGGTTLQKEHPAVAVRDLSNFLKGIEVGKGIAEALSPPTVQILQQLGHQLANAIITQQQEWTEGLHAWKSARTRSPQHEEIFSHAKEAQASFETSVIEAIHSTLNYLHLRKGFVPARDGELRAKIDAIPFAPGIMENHHPDVPPEVLYPPFESLKNFDRSEFQKNVEAVSIFLKHATSLFDGPTGPFQSANMELLREQLEQKTEQLSFLIADSSYGPLSSRETEQRFTRSTKRNLQFVLSVLDAVQAYQFPIVASGGNTDVQGEAPPPQMEQLYRALPIEDRFQSLERTCQQLSAISWELYGGGATFETEARIPQQTEEKRENQ